MGETGAGMQVTLPVAEAKSAPWSAGLPTPAWTALMPHSAADEAGGAAGAAAGAAVAEVPGREPRYPAAAASCPKRVGLLPGCTATAVRGRAGEPLLRRLLLPALPWGPAALLLLPEPAAAL